MTLGARDSPQRKVDLQLAKNIGETCYNFYQSTLTKLGPESVRFYSYNVSGQGWYILNSVFLIRPETIESIFYLYRITKDPIYREWGWKIFEAIKKNCKVEGGYAAYIDVEKNLAFDSNENQLDYDTHKDEIPSFVFAETFKYLYLLFDSPDNYSLDDWVFNTEAHLLKINK